MQIVPTASAQINGNGARNISMACTHTELSKFGRPEEARFQRLWNQLDVVVKNALKRLDKLHDAEEFREVETDGQREDRRLRDRFAQLNTTEVPRDDSS